MQVDNGGSNAEEKRNRRVRMEEELQKLASSQKFFHFLLVGAGHWTLSEAKELAKALSLNKSVTDLMVNLHACPIAAIPLFSQYIRSNRKLEKVTVCFCPSLPDRNQEHIQQEYQQYMRQVLRDVLNNPSVKELQMYKLVNCPEEIVNLLSNTTSLTTFEFDSYAITNEMAVALRDGMAKNTSLTKVGLSADGGPLDIAMAGIGASSSSSKIESLLVGHAHPNEQFFSALSKVLHVNRYLKTLEVGHADLIPGFGNENDAWFDPVFFDLLQPVCATLEKLILREVRLGGSELGIDLSNTLLMQDPNDSLQILELHNPKFANRSSVRMLWNFVGLKELCVVDPTLCSSSTAADQNDDDQDVVMTEADDEDDDDDDDVDWSEFFWRNKNLEKLSVSSEWDDSHRSILGIEGIVSGACGHESLATMSIQIWAGAEEGRVDRRVGAMLCKLLRETKSLEKVTLSGTEVVPEGAMLLAQGIYESKSLRSFDFAQSDDDRGFVTLPALTLTLGSLRINQSLKVFKACADTPFENNDIDEQTFFWTLAGVFRFNTSLESFKMPIMDISGQNMNLLRGGLHENKTMKLIDFSACTLDQDAWTFLVQALMAEARNALSISSIALPRFRDKEAAKYFLHHLDRMPCIENVLISDTLNAEESKLLLQAIKKKKTLHSFNRGTDPVNYLVDIEIDFYLKLNRCGRQIFDCPQVIRNVWPIILSRMTSGDKSDMDALFYFLNSYLPNDHKPTKPQLLPQRAQQLKRSRPPREPEQPTLLQATPQEPQQSHIMVPSPPSFSTPPKNRLTSSKRRKVQDETLTAELPHHHHHHSSPVSIISVNDWQRIPPTKRYATGNLAPVDLLGRFEKEHQGGGEKKKAPVHDRPGELVAARAAAAVVECQCHDSAQEEEEEHVPTIVTTVIDLDDDIHQQHEPSLLFRDRRPRLYEVLLAVIVAVVLVTVLCLVVNRLNPAPHSVMDSSSSPQLLEEEWCTALVKL